MGGDSREGGSKAAGDSESNVVDSSCGLEQRAPREGALEIGQWARSEPTVMGLSLQGRASLFMPEVQPDCGRLVLHTRHELGFEPQHYARSGSLRT